MSHLVQPVSHSTAPEYIDDQFQCKPLDVIIEAALPRSSLVTLLIDVRAATTATLVQVKVHLQ